MSAADPAETLRLAADAAGAAIRPYFRAADPGVALKDDRSPVTRADREAEAAIRAVIASRHPEDAILGEEGGMSGPAGGAGSWVIDPIDGTRAFITGRPLFTTLIARCEDGVPVLGMIDQPITAERWFGATAPASRTVFDRRTVRTRTGRRLGEAELSATSPDMFAPAERARFERLATAAGRTSWGGDAYAYGLLALGLIDVVAEASMRFWDWAAIVPVVVGAGGVVTDWNGAALRADKNGATLRADGDGTVLAAGSAALHAEALAALRA